MHIFNKILYFPPTSHKTFLPNGRQSVLNTILLHKYISKYRNIENNIIYSIEIFYIYVYVLLNIRLCLYNIYIV